ncbi:MAG: hypothetical protein ABFR82_00435 [Nitrospirota bacterium]
MSNDSAYGKIFSHGFAQIDADTYFTKKKNLRESAKIRGKKEFMFLYGRSK